MASTPDATKVKDKDAELEKRMEAIRKKNEAIMKRYEEIKQDKQRAEAEGMAINLKAPKSPSGPHIPNSPPGGGDGGGHRGFGGGRNRDRGKPDFDDREHPRHDPGGRQVDSDGLTVTIRKSGGGGGGGGGGGPSVEGREERVVIDRRKGRDRERFQPSKGASRQPSDRPSPPGAGPGATPGPPQAAGPGAGIGGPPRGVGVSERGGRGRGKRDGLGRGEKVDRSSKEWEERRRQNIEKMNEEMEQIAEYERGRRDGKVDKNPVRHFLDDVRRAGTYADQEGAERREGSRRHQRNWGGADFDRVKTGMEKRRDMERQGTWQQGGSDMSLSMTGRQRAEYSRWKEEREAIDRARLDRHKNASGEWRREWDAQKTDEMFKANQVPVPDGNDANFRGNRKRLFGVRFKLPDDHRRPPKNRNLGDFVSAPAASSPVKTRDTRSPGRERLTGRARNYSMHDDRWEESNDEQPSRAVDQAQVRASDPDRLEQAEGQNNDDDEWEDADEGDEDDGEEEVEVIEESQSPERAAVNLDQSQPKEDPVRGKPPVPKAKAKQCEQRPKRTRNAPRLTLPERDPVLEGAERSPADDSASTASKPPTPYSPFSPGDGYQPVGDWGEAMEAASPQSDSPPRPAQPTDAAGVAAGMEQGSCTPPGGKDARTGGLPLPGGAMAQNDGRCPPFAVLAQGSSEASSPGVAAMIQSDPASPSAQTELQNSVPNEVLDEQSVKRVELQTAAQPGNATVPSVVEPALLSNASVEGVDVSLAPMMMAQSDVALSDHSAAQSEDSEPECSALRVDDTECTPEQSDVTATTASADVECEQGSAIMMQGGSGAEASSDDIGQGSAKDLNNGDGARTDPLEKVESGDVIAAEPASARGAPGGAAVPSESDFVPTSSANTAGAEVSTELSFSTTPHSDQNSTPDKETSADDGQPIITAPADKGSSAPAVAEETIGEKMTAVTTRDGASESRVAVSSQTHTAMMESAKAPAESEVVEKPNDVSGEGKELSARDELDATAATSVEASAMSVGQVKRAEMSSEPETRDSTDENPTA
ncbi:uncharacterized protein LOC116947373 isoform X1 [Petromyzon marinus]|uniref:uncharacterized protein LOC116947373 isoform X1 n=2 Tax=Petromyzon marinus TaxID=7757 RepID=UPI003F7076B7